MPRRLDISVLLESSRLNFAGEMTFPQTVAALSEIGVERYGADLARLEKTHYAAGGESATVPLPLSDAPEISPQWSADAIAAAIRSSQRREIEYPQFLRQIMAAGCAAYWVFLAGRRAVYFGRHGDVHVEHFPTGS